MKDLSKLSLEELRVEAKRLSEDIECAMIDLQFVTHEQGKRAGVGVVDYILENPDEESS